MKTETSAGGVVYQNIPQGRQWLVVQHSYQPQHWGFPKGLIGDIYIGETMESAALREVREEGGVIARIIAPVYPANQYSYAWQGEVIEKTVHYFLMQYVSGSPNEHDAEILQAKFIPEKKVEARLSYENDRLQFHHALKLLSSIMLP